MSAEAISSQPSDRAQQLLRVLIQRYIREGQPIGSRTLSKDPGLDLSPATIRNVMSDLEDMGMVSAPHTSAGRVPTPKGYRLFVDTLVRYRQPRENDIDMLRSQIRRKVDDARALISSVSNLLSEFTNLAGVVTVPRGQHAALRQIEFLSLSENRILAILVINDREVQNRILHTDRNYSPSELQQAANFINQHYAGIEMPEVRSMIVEDLEKARHSMNQAMHDIIAVAQSAMEGVTQPGHADGVQIFIGEESGYQILDDCSVVTAPYQLDDDTIGVLGVIGPTRMAYDRVVPIVDITARLLRSALNQ